MRINYGLKASQRATFVEPLVKHLEQNYDIQTAYKFKGILEKINELRTRATSMNMRPQTSPEEIDKNIELLSAYLRYSLVILNRFNWDSQRGKCVEGLELSWFDSFQPKLEFHRHTISFDIFCGYYNLAVMQFTRAMKLGEVELDSSRKEAVSRAKIAAFLLREMKERFYKEFVECGFHDTQFPHLDIIENMSLGLIYRCTFDAFKENEYKIGINKIAAICGLASKYFYKAYVVASTYFMTPSGISDKTKTEILAFTYFSSLYLDVMTNTRYAKHYGNEMEKDSSNIVLVLAYERKALRLLEIGLNNQSVQMLFNQNPKQKAELIKVRDELKQSLAKNVMRNNQIYKQKEISEANIPPPDDLPQQYLIKLEKPPSLVMENEGQFAHLMSEESYNLAQQMIEFSKSKKGALQTSTKKLEEEIDKAYNDSYVNFYLQMVGDSRSTVLYNLGTIPRALQEKLHDIRKQGGKQKVLQVIQQLTDNQKLANSSFMQLKQQLNDEEYLDMQKRNQYGQQWTRKPSTQVNQQYATALKNLEGKFKTAVGVDAKILEKYTKNQPYVETLNSSDEEILRILPKPEQTQFAETYKGDLAKLKEKSDAVRKRKDYLTELSLQIIDAFSKINYPMVANQYLAEKLLREDAFRGVFGEIELMITKFNAECSSIKEDVQVAATIAVSLNGRNKESDGKAKREFEVVIASYAEISQIFKDCTVAMVFYDKLNGLLAKLTADVEDYVYGRKQSLNELQTSINSKKGNMGGNGGGGFVNPLPDMYPGQKKEPLPEFVPPPIPPSLFDQGQSLWGPEKQGFSVFEGGTSTNKLHSIPQDPFKGPVYSESVQPLQQPLQFPSNPFAGQVFKSQMVRK